MTTETPMKKATLYYKQGGSDKVYQAEVKIVDGGYVVNFAYGRRGSTLTTGTKTASPVASLAAAEQIFDKLVREKKAKGYTPGEDGTPYLATTDAERVTGINCQLLNPVGVEALEALFKDDNFGAQEKFDGKRMLLRAAGAERAAINRSGLTCGMPEPVSEATAAVQKRFGDFVVDGEAVGEYFYAFDQLNVKGNDIREREYRYRYSQLSDLLRHAGQRHIVLADLVIGEEAKRALYADLKAKNREGIVFKRLDAPYTAGRPNKGGAQLKHRFLADPASCLVKKVNGSKRSVALQVAHGGALIDIGNCTIPANFEIPKPGQIVEISYLYCYPGGGKLYIPVYLGVRDDKTEPDAYESLKFKSEYESEEEDA